MSIQPAYIRILFISIGILLAVTACQAAGGAIPMAAAGERFQAIPHVEWLDPNREYFAENTQRVHTLMRLSPSSDVANSAGFQVTISSTVTIPDLLDEVTVTLQRGTTAIELPLSLQTTEMITGMTTAMGMRSVRWRSEVISDSLVLRTAITATTNVASGEIWLLKLFDLPPSTAITSRVTDNQSTGDQITTVEVDPIVVVTETTHLLTQPSLVTLSGYGMRNRLPPTSAGCDEIEMQWQAQAGSPAITTTTKSDFIEGERVCITTGTLQLESDANNGQHSYTLQGIVGEFSHAAQSVVDVAMLPTVTTTPPITPIPAPTVTDTPTATSSPTTLSVLTGHTNSVTSVEWSPDSTRLASSAEDGTVRIWDANGAYLHSLVGHTDRITGVDWSPPDGARLATSSYDKTIRIWDGDGTLLNTLEEHSHSVLAVKWNPDGSLLASASLDGSIAIWGANGDLLRKIEDDSTNLDYWRNVAWSPDGNRLATPSSANVVHIWDVAGNLLNSFPLEIGHDSPGMIAWSPDGNHIATSASNGAIQVWTPDGTPLYRFGGGPNAHHSGDRHNVAWSPDSTRIIAGAGFGDVLIWSVDGTLLQRLHGGNARVNAVAWSPDGIRIAAGSDDGTVYIWQIDPP